jgi:hypothetical protein
MKTTYDDYDGDEAITDMDKNTKLSDWDEFLML